MVNFDADVKNTTACHQYENRLITGLHHGVASVVLLSLSWAADYSPGGSPYRGAVSGLTGGVRTERRAEGAAAPRMSTRLTVVMRASQARMCSSRRRLLRSRCVSDLSIPNIEGSITVQIVRNVSPTCARRDQ